MQLSRPFRPHCGFSNDCGLLGADSPSPNVSDMVPWCRQIIVCRLLVPLGLIEGFWVTVGHWAQTPKFPYRSHWRFLDDCGPLGPPVSLNFTDGSWVWMDPSEWTLSPSRPQRWVPHVDRSLGTLSRLTIPVGFIESYQMTAHYWAGLPLLVGLKMVPKSEKITKCRLPIPTGPTKSSLE